MRYFHNFYAVISATDAFGITLGFDAGLEESTPSGEDHHFWFSPVLIARYAVSDNVAVAARAEYYQDEHGVIVATGTPNGFQTFGYSVNVDVMPASNAMLRFEGRLFQSAEDEIFSDVDGAPSKTNAFIGAALAVSF
jgi:hypothetical protein